MDDVTKKILKISEEMRKEVEITDESTKAEILRAQIIKGAKTKEGYLEIEKELQDFMKTNPSQEDRDMITQYICPFSMTCSAIKKGLL